MVGQGKHREFKEIEFEWGPCKRVFQERDLGLEPPLLTLAYTLEGAATLIGVHSLSLMKWSKMAAAAMFMTDAVTRGSSGGGR